MMVDNNFIQVVNDTAEGGEYTITITVPGSCTECSLEAKSIWMVDMKTFLCDNCLFVI